MAPVCCNPPRGQNKLFNKSFFNTVYCRKMAAIVLARCLSICPSFSENAVKNDALCHAAPIRLDNILSVGAHWIDIRSENGNCSCNVIYFVHQLFDGPRQEIYLMKKYIGRHRICG